MGWQFDMRTAPGHSHLRMSHPLETCLFWELDADAERAAQEEPR
jgi:hypothetical protein